MRKQAFGDSQVSVIGLGSGNFGGKTAESQAREFMDAYAAMGGNLIDTARVYGDFVTPRSGESEKVIGRWLTDRRCRKDIFLSTKGGHPPLHDMHRSRLSREEIRGDMAESLHDLQTDYVDIFWLHRDDESRPVGGIMETLQSLIEDGSARMIGVSNWRPERIEEANRYADSHGLTPLTANQPQFSLARQVRCYDPTLTIMDAKTWRMHRQTGMICCCFSSQAGGFFTKLEASGWEKLPENLKNDYGCEENLHILEKLWVLRGEIGLSVGSLALAYLTCQPFPTFALVGASRIEHVLALKEAGDAVLSPGSGTGFACLKRDGPRPYSFMIRVLTPGVVIVVDLPGNARRQTNADVAAGIIGMKLLQTFSRVESDTVVPNTDTKRRAVRESGHLASKVQPGKRETIRKSGDKSSLVRS
ncbi:MAG: aldo/keto reductase [Clostridia bacterium]|nr:aldo/keto reductase [Clostridia bacterium]